MMVNVMMNESPDSKALQGRTPAATRPLADSATASMLHTMERWTSHGWLRSLDEALVLFLHELDPKASPLVLLAAALALIPRRMTSIPVLLLLKSII